MCVYACEREREREGRRKRNRETRRRREGEVFKGLNVVLDGAGCH